jgi:hypothetical protein
MKSVTTGFVVPLLVTICGCASLPSGATQPATGPGTQPAKTVLALQAFLDEASERRIAECWQAAMKIPGVKCAGALGARPHITFGSWRVTEAELAEAVGGFARFDAALPGQTIVLGPSVEEHPDGSADYYFIPKSAGDIHEYHRRVRERLSFPYETFRQIDVPGRWEPHLTMFTCPKDRRDEVDALFRNLSDASTARIGSFGLVTFGPIQARAQVRCASH